MTVEELKEELEKWPNHLIVEFIFVYENDPEIKIQDFKREYGKLLISMEEE